MDRTPIRRAALVAAALAAAGCASATDHVLSIDSNPPGASVRLVVDGRPVGQTPIKNLHIHAPEGKNAGKNEVIVLDMQNHQSIAYEVGKDCPDHLFFSLQDSVDLVPIENALTELQNNVRSIRETVEAMQAAAKKGGN